MLADRPIFPSLLFLGGRRESSEGKGREGAVLFLSFFLRGRGVGRGGSPAGWMEADAADAVPMRDRRRRKDWKGRGFDGEKNDGTRKYRRNM